MKLLIDMIGVTDTREHYRILCFPTGNEEPITEEELLMNRQVELIIGDDHYTFENAISDEFPNAWYLNVTRLSDSPE